LTCIVSYLFFFFFSSRRRHTRLQGDWSSDVCSSDLEIVLQEKAGEEEPMPLVVGELLDEVLDLVGATPSQALAITQLFGLGAEFATQVTLCLIHVPVGIWLMHGERFER